VHIGGKQIKRENIKKVPFYFLGRVGNTAICIYNACTVRDNIRFHRILRINLNSCQINARDVYIYNRTIYNQRLHFIAFRRVIRAWTLINISFVDNNVLIF